ncbi:hypothetical protein OG562_44445 [Streptomyces sp. NBC_01275]|uniref:hypothetical protein n=1 Tax=Streptomyces sp. NBC_01275 TaxID=2903807 RepID=UPI002256F1C6|nr:hypothetical protein [Streptomyces sp. NBC_01275]MCX4767877.1 hypothetical protein [Streptomyces sp. NBC_01275]
MTPFLVPLAVAALIVAVCTVVLVRRDRSRTAASVESLRIGTAAPRGLRDTRRRAHACGKRFPREHD